jgi:lipopolysaccharide transport system ATP-binding protein
MPEDVVIRAQGLGKKYMIGHAAERERYVALRDVLVRGAHNFWRRTIDMARGRVILGGDAIEEFWALRNVSFEVKRGEVLGIIGRNGAGKSTLLKILSRITEPSAGRMTIKGRVASLLEVGTGFHPELTGRENIYLNGAILGMTRAEIRRKFDEIVAFAEVEKFLDTPVKRYSSGMYVRLAFAVAAHLEPDILVVDEVLAVGDAEFQKKCLGKMSEVAGGGRTVLFVSHNMTAVGNLCYEAMILQQGELRFFGGAKEAVRQYSVTDLHRGDQIWMRTCSPGSSNSIFDQISVSVRGKQPSLTLLCDIRLLIQTAQSSCFLAVDVTDAFGSSIMQALPSASPYVPGVPGTYNFRLEIALPPLIPDKYWLTFWIGPHNLVTYDIIYRAVAFEVFTSPTPGRTFPHTSDHGHIVPASRVLRLAQGEAAERGSLLKSGVRPVSA